jgi:hypothetical protein
MADSHARHLWASSQLPIQCRIPKSSKGYHFFQITDIYPDWGLLFEAKSEKERVTATTYLSTMMKRLREDVDTSDVMGESNNEEAEGSELDSEDDEMTDSVDVGNTQVFMKRSMKSKQREWFPIRKMIPQYVLPVIP